MVFKKIYELCKKVAHKSSAEVCSPHERDRQPWAEGCSLTSLNWKIVVRRNAPLNIASEQQRNRILTCRALAPKSVTSHTLRSPAFPDGERCASRRRNHEERNALAEERARCVRARELTHFFSKLSVFPSLFIIFRAVFRHWAVSARVRHAYRGASRPY